MSAALPNDEKVLINAPHKDFSFADPNRALPSSPMIGEAFLELLRTAPTAALWHWRVAAQLALSVVDQALNTDGPDERLVRVARREIHNPLLCHVTLRGHLQALVDIATGPRGEHWRESVAKRLLKFAEFLRNIGHFEASGEVFRMVAETGDLQASVRIAAYQGMAWVARQLGLHPDADLIYIQMRTLAEEVGNTPMVFMAELGAARVMIERGGGSQADRERTVREIIDRARRLGFDGVVARAHIDLSNIAGANGRFDEAIIHANVAREGPVPPIDYDLGGINMAMAYRMFGDFFEATAFAQGVVETAEGLEERLCAGVILYHLAMDQELDTTGVRQFFEREGERMSAQVRAELYEAKARDAYLADDILTAQRELSNGITFAESHGRRLNQMIVQMDGALKDIEAKRFPASFVAPNGVAPVNTAPTLRHIGDAARKAEAVSHRNRHLRTDPATAGDPPRLLVETFVRVVAAGG